MKQHNRGFLNPKEGMAAFEWFVSTHQDVAKRKWIDASFSISDCSRKIHLEFECNNERYSEDTRTKEDSLEKLDLLIVELQKFRAVIESIELVKENNE